MLTFRKGTQDAFSIDDHGNVFVSGRIKQDESDPPKDGELKIAVSESQTLCTAQRDGLTDIHLYEDKAEQTKSVATPASGSLLFRNPSGATVGFILPGGYLNLKGEIYKQQKYRIVYTGMFCHRMQEGIYSKDEPYAIILIAAWGRGTNYLPSVVVKHTSVYAGVGSDQGRSEYITLWDGPTDNLIILVQAMENDGGSPDMIAKELEISALAYLSEYDELSQTYTFAHENASRAEIMSALRIRMEESIDLTSKLGSEVFGTGEWIALHEMAKKSVSSWDGRMELFKKALLDGSEFEYTILVGGTQYLLRRIQDPDDRVGSIHELNLNIVLLDAVLSAWNAGSYIFDGGTDHGKYEYKFSWEAV